jgi:hypothetical protein
MGCDIHMILQKRKKGIWHIVRQVNIGRDYDLFTILADVRSSGDLEPITERRGIPPDVKHKMKSERYIEFPHTDNFGITYMDAFLGEHSFSWLRLREILKYYAKHWTNKRVRESLNEFLKQLEPYIKKGGVYRVVFGFDS